MITSHHSFSTRIFLNQTPGGTADATQPATGAGPQENLREFWWFLRSGRGQVQGAGAVKPASGGSAAPVPASGPTKHA